MPFQAKIQPMDPGSAAKIDPSKPKQSLLRRFFPLRTPLTAAGPIKVEVLTKAEVAAPTKADVDRDFDDSGGDGAKDDVESSVSLGRMVVSYMEDATETTRPPKNRCGGCFNGNRNEGSDDEADLQYGDVNPVAPPPGETFEIIRSLVPCTTVIERNLLADVSRIMERNRNLRCGRSELRKIVVDALKLLGYDAAVCRSKWESTGSIPCGEHEYIDVIAGGTRLLVEIDFRSEFEVARPSVKYDAAIRSLPSIYVGTADRMAKIVALAADVTKKSMRETGLTFSPWRRSEYMKAKWLSKHVRLGTEGSGGTKVAGRDISVNFEVCRAERITFMVRPSEVVIGKPKKKPVAGLTAVL